MFGEVSKPLSAEMNEIWLISQTSKISKTTISPKRFEITLSIWYAISSGVQALSIGKSYGPLWTSKRSYKEDSGLKFGFSFRLQKKSETIVANI